MLPYSAGHRHTQVCLLQQGYGGNKGWLIIDTAFSCSCVRHSSHRSFKMEQGEVKKKRKITLAAGKAPKVPVRSKTREEINKKIGRAHV